MVSGKPTAWKNAKRDETQARRDLILRAATNRLNQLGYARASMTAIAAELGLSTNALYYYFASKTDILYECFDRALSFITGCVEAAERAPGNGNAKVCHFAMRFRELIELEPLPGPWLIVHLPRPQIVAIGQRDAAFRARLHTIVRAGIDDGSIRNFDVESTVGILLSGLFGLPYQRLTDELGDDKLRAQLLGFVERALAP